METLAVALIAAVAPFFIYKFDARRADKQDAEMEELAKSLNMPSAASRIRENRQLRVAEYASTPWAFKIYRLLLIISWVFGGLGAISGFYWVVAQIKEDANISLVVAAVFLLHGIAIPLICLYLLMRSLKRLKKQNPQLDTSNKEIIVVGNVSNEHAATSARKNSWTKTVRKLKHWLVNLRRRMSS